MSMNRRSFMTSLVASGIALAGCRQANAQQTENVGTYREASTTSGMRYRVFLPSGYHDSVLRYSVLFHLHGATQSWDGLRADVEVMAAAAETAVSAGKIDPMIIVAPHDTSGWSMWSDSHDGSIDIATQIVTELIPKVDAEYRTWAVRECRAIQGFSMGGFGAATLLFKHSELFGAGIVWDGAMHDWATLRANRAAIARDQFGGSEEQFDQWSPWANAAEPASLGQPIMVVRGALQTFYDGYSGYLSEIGHTPTLAESPCGHTMECLAQATGAQAMTFLAEHLDA